MNNKAYHIVVLVLSVVIIFASVVLGIDRIGEAFFGFKWNIHCAMKHTFGIRCALCGMTHSFSEMALGDIAKAFEYHRLGPVAFIFVVFQIPYRVAVLSRGFRRTTSQLKKWNKYIAFALLAAVIINWLVCVAGSLS